MMKKGVKISLIILGIFLLISLVFGIICRDILINLLINKYLEGPRGEGPVATTTKELEIEKGSHDWTSWRGPGDDGKSTITGIRTDWTGGLTKEWEIDWLCKGRESAAWSAPVIQGRHLIVEGRHETEDVTFCLNAETGELIWEARIESFPGTNHGTGPRATSAIDDDRVYSLNRAGDLLCRHLSDGRLLWQKNLVAEGGKVPLFGFCSSPLIYDNLVLVEAGGDAGTIAFHKITGEVAWKCPTSTITFTSLTKITIQNRDFILSVHEKGLSAIAPLDGKEVWFTPFGSIAEKATTPTAWGEKIFIAGIIHGCQLIEVDGNSLRVLWKSGVLQPHHSDPVIIDSYLYGYSGESSQNRGTFKCLDLTSGTVMWETKKIGWGTLIYVDSHLICMDIKGNLFLVTPDPREFIPAQEMRQVFGRIRGPVWTVPVAANGRLYVRYKQQLVCFHLKK
jgi:outer membrane protein assembly factor BamB